MMNATGQTARSAALVAALIVGALLLIGTLFGAAATIFGILGDTWNGRVDLITGSAPQVAVDGAPADAVASETNGVTYSGALVTADAPLALPRALQVAAAALGALVMIGGGLLLVMLAVRMLRTRPFARILAWGLGLVGLVAILAATVAPQLEAAAVSIGIRDLGYALYDDAHDGSFVAGGPDALALPLWDPLWMLDRVDPVLLMVGITLGVLGFLVADAVRMQRDTEGLV
ncbi:MAG: hypothetical protein ACTIKT_06570 [Microbacterium sp.]